MKKNQNPQSKKPEVIREVLSAKSTVSAGDDKTTLSFDMKSGDLIISSKKIESDENVVVDQIYKDGFFCNKKAA